MEKNIEKPTMIILKNSKDNILNYIINSLNETNNQIIEFYYKNILNPEENMNKEKELLNDKNINLEFKKAFSLSENLTFDEKELINNINNISDEHIKTINQLITQLDYNILIEDEEETIKTIYNSNTFEDDIIDDDNLNEYDENNLEMRFNKYQFTESSNNEVFNEVDLTRLSEFRQDSKTKFDLIEREFKTNFIINKNPFKRIDKKRNFTLPNQKIHPKNNYFLENNNINKNSKKNCNIY